MIHNDDNFALMKKQASVCVVVNFGNTYMYIVYDANGAVCEIVLTTLQHSSWYTLFYYILNAAA